MKELILINSNGDVVPNTTPYELSDNELVDDYALLEAATHFVGNYLPVKDDPDSEFCGLNLAKDDDNTFSIFEIRSVFSGYKIKIIDETKTKPILLRPVESQMVNAIGYDKDTLELFVEFRKGSVYCYSDVLPDVHKNLVEADSIGEYMHDHIFDVYSYRRISI